MAGRGRGRGGRGRGMSFNVENLGLGRGEMLPAGVVAPPPVYPDFDAKTVPLPKNEEWNYLLALKQEFRANMKDSIFHIEPEEKKKDIERYSDKYEKARKQGSITWSRIPKELHHSSKTHSSKGRKRAQAAPNVGARKNRKLMQDADVVKKLEELEEREANPSASAGGDEDKVPRDEDEEEEEGGPAKKKKDDDDDDDDEAEVEVEEPMEEEELDDDYAMTYFDNGENFALDDEDDLEDEGAIY